MTLAINKVVYGEETLIDLTEDTATADVVANGYTLHLASGDRTVGTAKYAASPEANGSATFANGIHYAHVNSTSTSKVYTATIPGITELYDGLTVMLYNGVVTSASGFTININGLGAYGVYTSMALGNNSADPKDPTRETTIFNINYAMMLTYCTNIGNRGTAGWIFYRGYDSNTNTIGYQVRTNSSTLPMKSIVYRYRLLFTSADGAHFVPANNSTSTNATSARAVCQDPIDPFGRILYYGTTAAVSAGSRPAAASLWQQYAINFGYSFQTSPNYNLAEWHPIYLKCAPQSDGSAIIDSTTPFVQTLPATEDGKIYIFLGVAYSDTSMELTLEHPVYYYKDGMIRPWTNGSSFSGDYNDLSNKPTIPSKTSDLTNDSGFITSVPVTSVNSKTGAVNLTASDVGAGTYSKPSSGIPASDLASAVQTSLGKADTALQSYTETDPTVPAWAKAANKPTYTASEVGLGNVDNVRQYSASNPPPYPVTSVNGATGEVSLTASDVGALPNTTSIPSKTSDLTNDSGYVNATQAANAAPVQSVNGNTGAVTVEVPTKVSDLTNDAGLTSVSFSSSLDSGTKIGTITIDGTGTDLYAPTDTDTKVTQTYATASGYTYWRPLVIGYSSGSSESFTPSTATDTTYVFSTFKVQPSSGTIKATTFKGALNGTINSATTATTQAATDNSTKVATTAFVKNVLPTKVSDLTNDAGYLTLATLPRYNGGVS